MAHMSNQSHIDEFLHISTHWPSNAYLLRQELSKLTFLRDAKVVILAGECVECRVQPCCDKPLTLQVHNKTLHQVQLAAGPIGQPAHCRHIYNLTRKIYCVCSCLAVLRPPGQEASISKGEII